jgi:hypothetical protein
MRREPHGEAKAEAPRDIRLEEGCLLCGGDLEVRISGATARSYCTSCRWLSKPHMQRQGDGIHAVHPAGGIA